MTNEWPSDVIDHIDGDRTNNRWCNLRVTNNQVNRENTHKARVDSSTGIQGVSPCRQGAAKGFQAKIRSQGKQYYLGVYSDPEAAHAVYLAAKLVMHAGWVPKPGVLGTRELRRLATASMGANPRARS